MTPLSHYAQKVLEWFSSQQVLLSKKSCPSHHSLSSLRRSQCCPLTIQSKGRKEKEEEERRSKLDIGKPLLPSLSLSLFHFIAIFFILFLCMHQTLRSLINTLGMLIETQCMDVSFETCKEPWLVLHTRIGITWLYLIILCFPYVLIGCTAYFIKCLDVEIKQEACFPYEKCKILYYRSLEFNWLKT